MLPSPLQQGHSLSPPLPGPQGPSAPAVLPLQAEVKGSDPNLLLPVPMSQRSCCWGPFPAPLAHTIPCCRDDGGGVSEAQEGARC